MIHSNEDCNGAIASLKFAEWSGPGSFGVGLMEAGEHALTPRQNILVTVIEGALTVNNRPYEGSGTFRLEAGQSVNLSVRQRVACLIRSF